MRVHRRAAVLALSVLIAVLGLAVAGTASAQTSFAGAGPHIPVFRGIQGLAGPAAAQQAPVPPMHGVTPAVAASGDTSNPVVFAYTGSDRHAYVAPLTAPAQEVSLGGSLIGGPGLAFVPAPLGPGWAAFARGGNSALYEYAGGTSWSSLGGTLTSRPGVAAGALSVAGGEAIDVFVRGTDEAIWYRQITAAGVTPWRSLGGRVQFSTGPGAVNVGGTLYVIVVGTDGAVYADRSTDGAHWSGWRPMFGRFGGGDVGAATPAPGTGIAFVRGLDETVWYNEFAGTTPGVSPGWHRYGGKVGDPSGPAAGSVPHGSTTVMMLGPDEIHLYMRTGTWPKLGPWNLLV